MRPILWTILFAAPLLFGSFDKSDSFCDPEELIQECKENLPPYSYSNSRTFMSKKGTSREIPVKLLRGEEYRLVFNVRKLPSDALIEVYDGPEGSNRDLLMSSENFPKDRERLIFEPEKKDGDELYVSYEIPPTSDRTCFTFVVGYRLTFVED